MARLVCKRWHDKCKRYWCLSVGLVWRSVSTWPNWSRETLTSRKEMDVYECEDVHFIEGWRLLRYVMKASTSSSVRAHIMKMSAMKRHQICGWRGARRSASVSNFARNRHWHYLPKTYPISQGPCGYNHSFPKHEIQRVRAITHGDRLKLGQVTSNQPSRVPLVITYNPALVLSHLLYLNASLFNARLHVAPTSLNPYTSSCFSTDRQP